MQAMEVEGVPVECIDGPCGRAKYVILDPDSAVVTHIVVGEPDALAETRLVPLSGIAEGTRELIRLEYTKDELRLLPLFAQYDYAQSDESHPIHMGPELWMGSLMPYLPIISHEAHRYLP
jgi:hypothetical protein